MRVKVGKHVGGFISLNKKSIRRNENYKGGRRPGGERHTRVKQGRGALRGEYGNSSYLIKSCNYFEGAEKKTNQGREGGGATRKLAGGDFETGKGGTSAGST